MTASGLPVPAKALATSMILDIRDSGSRPSRARRV